MEKLRITPYLKLDCRKHQVINTRTGTIKSLEPRLVQLLQLLVKANGQVVSRETLIQSIWGNYNSGDQLLTHSISLLRKTLGEGLIQTIPKQGYVLLVRRKEANRSISLSTSQIIGLSFFVLFMIKLLFFGHH